MPNYEEKIINASSGKELRAFYRESIPGTGSEDVTRNYEVYVNASYAGGIE